MCRRNDFVYVATEAGTVQVFDQLQAKSFHMVQEVTLAKTFKPAITGLAANDTHFFVVNGKNVIHILDDEFQQVQSVRAT